MNTKPAQTSLIPPLAQSALAADVWNTLPYAMSLLRWAGKPFSLRKHFFFYPCFDIVQPPYNMWKCGRQVAKSLTALAAAKLVRASIFPDHHILFVNPRYDQTKRFSTDRVKQLMVNAAIPGMFLDRKNEQTIDHRSLPNGSILYFSFAFLDAERIRGFATKEVVVDEAQDVDWDFLPIIDQVLMGSEDLRLRTYTGTPKTFDNPLEKLWNESSQAEWVTKCTHCNHENIPSIGHDLLGMIGPTTVVCAKCRKQLYPHTGRWVHAIRERRDLFVGRHLPQVIHPYHYEDPQHWQELLRNQRLYPEYRFMNECLGESFESSERLINMSDLRAACNPNGQTHQNTIRYALSRLRDFPALAMGVDWGGGGEGTRSYTAVCIAGLLSDNRAQVLYVERFHRGMSKEDELARIKYLYDAFNPLLFAHDYGGAGANQETLLIHSGIPRERFQGFTYQLHPTKPVIFYQPPVDGYRHSYKLDKTRSLLVICEMIKAGNLIFPSWETTEIFLEDFLHLVEERVAGPRKGDVILIRPMQGTSDDVCHAVNYACSILWHAGQTYPSLSRRVNADYVAEEVNPEHFSVRGPATGE